MIIQERLPNGQRRPVLEGETLCPFAYHIHGGDATEKFLEMIICEEKYNQMLKEM